MILLGKFLSFIAISGLLALVGCGETSSLQEQLSILNETPVAHLNTKVLDFARSRLGQQVGRGECWDLAYQALNAAGARLPGVAGYGITQFGTPVSTAIPGDIIQFEGVKFVYKNGSWRSMAHHTAIVEQVNGSTIGLIHQNSNGVRSPTRGSIDLHTKTQGTLTIYRPQLR